MSVDKVLDIGYKDDNSTVTGRIKRYCTENGADEQVIIWLLNLNYDMFIQKLKPWMASANPDGKLTMDDMSVIDTMYNRENFEENKRIVNETLDIYDFDDKNPNDNYVFPTREILNGNFPRTDKSKLSDEVKQNLNVHGLRDVEYDVYVDEKNNALIPVYYNIATCNEKWYAFCVYLSKIYFEMGIDANPYLPLITFDRDLLGMDMLVESNTNEFNGKVVHECETNIIFAVRECARFTDGGGKKERTEISLGDWTWLWLYAQCFNTYREAPRQTGKTFLMTMTFGIEFAISYEGLMAIVVHFKSDEAKKNRNKMLEFSNNLPTYLKSHNIKAKITKGVEKRFMGPDMVGGQAPKSTNIHKNNILKTVAVGKTESTAEQAGRGDTTQLIGADEINFISQIMVLLTALTFAHSTARTIAKRLGKRYGMHFTSTAGKLHTKHGKEMHKLIYTKMCMFDLELFGYSLGDLEIYLKKNSSVNFFVIKYDYDELGYTEEWLDERISMTKSVEDILVEIFQQWLSLDQTSLFKLDIIRRLEAMTKKVIERNYIYKKNNILKFYPPSNSISFEQLIKSLNAMCWGVDISAGGGDYSVIYAINMETLKPVFIYKTNNLVVTDFAIVLMDLMRFVKGLNPTMTFVVNPEQNGPGLSLIPLVIREPDLEPHIFRTIEFYDKRKGSTVTKGWHRQYSSDSFLNYGSNMSKKVKEGVNLRALMFETLLFEIVDKYPYALANLEALSETLTLHRKSGSVTGKIEAKSGFHDDIICAALHGLTVVLYDNNRNMLMRFFNYTVDPSKIINMAIASHIGNFGNEDDYVKSLDDTFDFEIQDIYTATGSMYQKLHVFKYLNGVKVLVKDEKEKSNIIEVDENIKQANIDLVRLTFKEVVDLSKSARSPENNRNELYESSSLQKRGTSSINRSASPSYLKQNRTNLKAKMF